MFEKIEPLDPSKHQNLRFSKISSFAFAGTISAIKLSFSELRQASRYYPIVFFKVAPCIPQAILSLENGKNACIDEAGNWKLPYVPAFIRFYPFTLVKVEEEEDKFVLCLDPEAEHFKSGMGEPLFTAEGKPVEFIDTVLKSMTTYQNELSATEVLFKRLDEKEVIVDRAIKYKLNQEEKSIDGFQGVDMEKLVTLDDKSLADMVKNGTMGIVHEHINSLVNFSNFLTPSPVAAPASDINLN